MRAKWLHLSLPGLDCYYTVSILKKACIKILWEVCGYRRVVKSVANKVIQSETK